MKKLLKVLVVLSLFAWLSSVVGAEEWKKMELPGEVYISWEMPQDSFFQKKEEAGRGWQYQYVSQGAVMVLKVEIFSLGPSKGDRYPFDVWKGAQAERFLNIARSNKQSPSALDVSYRKLKNGHTGMLGWAPSKQGAELYVIIDHYMVRMTIFCDGDQKEKKIQRVFDSLVF